MALGITNDITLLTEQRMKDIEERRIASMREINSNLKNTIASEECEKGSRCIGYGDEKRTAGCI